MIVKMDMNRSSPLVVALIIYAPHNNDLLLAVKRPDSPGEDLPGVWGLPAASVKPGETPHAAAYRIGLEKLGSSLVIEHWVISGYSDGIGGQTMYLYESYLENPEPELPDWSRPPVGMTFYTEWQWAPATVLETGARQGSLCCSLFMAIHGEALQKS